MTSSGGGVKRSLFSKCAVRAAVPAVTNSALTAGGGAGSIFSRNVNYEDIVRAERAQRERKAAKAKARSGGAGEKRKKSEGPDAKKRRISADDCDVGSGSASEVEKRKKKDDKVQRRPVTRSTPTKRKDLWEGLEASPKTRPSPRSKEAVKSTTIYLDDGDGEETEDDDLIKLTPAKPKNAGPDLLTEKDSDEEDEYLRLLKQKAREKARLHRQGGQTIQRSSTPADRQPSIAREDIDPNSPAGVHSQGTSRPASSNSVQDFEASAARTHKPPEQENDPEVKIMIQSQIPGTNSLIVKRKASQSLKQVKEFWCRKFDLEDSVARQVFFTWKGTRLFDSTTMRGIIRGLKKDYHRQQRPRSLSLGIEDVEENGDGDAGYDSSSAKDPSGGHIMLEAMTPELYDQRLRDKDRLRQRQRSLLTSSADGSDDEDEGGGDADQEGREHDTEAARAPLRTAAAAAVAERDKGAIVIRLVSKDLEPMQLRVRPNTTIGKIMRGFAATRKVDEAKTPWLIFDGERLDKESTVEEVGFEDEDEVEVSIR
ncbi:hypothetical protein AYO21_00053 [Fonsecaea monophora]|uniref:Ubiquitin-like domain-containing protein n=1 Tax=Fonsecaea monophora TaxID=254056 RepID=A0A177FQJ6_9EURO|nr:hypothetical protein AYO21_00053 [Fonsecaea monophora]KAH0842329.1 hypothetical protein FOPE_07383 [Fonsecaea pedrosoi]OAG45419.1 hypothetical protein AYO21_00053 [Fonsecaea monophora]